MAEWKEASLDELKEEFGFTGASIARPESHGGSHGGEVLAISVGSKAFRVVCVGGTRLRVDIRVEPPAPQWRFCIQCGVHGTTTASEPISHDLAVRNEQAFVRGPTWRCWIEQVPATEGGE